MSNKYSRKFLSYISDCDVISGSEILSILRNGSQGSKYKYKNLVIKDLCDEGIVYKYTQNLYKPFHNRKKFIPEKNQQFEKCVFPIVKNKNIEISYFDTKVYNSLSSLQATKSFILVLVEGYAENYLIDRLKKLNKEVITSKEFYTLSSLHNYSFNVDYIIKNINSDTPLNKKDSLVFAYPKIETILVDVLSDKTLERIYSSELENIFRSAFIKYAINMSTLVRYATKKGRLNELNSILDDIGFDKQIGEFVND